MKNPFSKAFRYFVDFDFEKIFSRPDLPLGYRIINWLLLLSTLPWPLLIFMSVFLFDAPGNENKAYVILFLVLMYPWVVLISTITGFNLYNKNRTVSYFLTILSASIVCILAYRFYQF